MYKKRDARAKLLSLLIEPFDFLTFSLPSESLDLKVPIKYGQWKTHQNGSVDQINRCVVDENETHTFLKTE